MSNRKWTGRAFGAALLVGSLGACDFITAEVDPNQITTPTLPSLYVSTQLSTLLMAEGNLARVAAVWTQQLSGADRQFIEIDSYQVDETTGDNEFNSLYTGGGLIDIRKGIAIADSVGCPQCAALFQIHEAYQVGMAASIWGDIPYSGILVLGEPAALDPQAQVYAAVQALLDEAIASLSVAPTGGALVFYNQLPTLYATSGVTGPRDRAAWIATANTLKARFYLHWVEAQLAGGAAAAQAQTACGGNCLTKAEAAAESGIETHLRDWRAGHSTAATESSLWYQFFDERAGYIVAGQYLVNLLQDTTVIGTADPRLPLYFSQVGPDTARTFRGKPAGGANPGASSLAELPSGRGAGDREYAVPIVTCAENYFILAEVNYYQSEPAAARDAFREGVMCAAALQGIADTLGGPLLTTRLNNRVNAATGPALLSEIITQKYIAGFQNIEVYNDYKRTCLPDIPTVSGGEIPGRLLYSQQERQTNPNIPSPDQQPDFNTNDPVRCA